MGGGALETSLGIQSYDLNATQRLVLLYIQRGG